MLPQFFQIGCINYTPIPQCSRMTVVLRLVNTQHYLSISDIPVSLYWYCIMTSICITLLTKDVEQLFMFTIWKSFYEVLIHTVPLFSFRYLGSLPSSLYELFIFFFYIRQFSRKKYIHIYPVVPLICSFALCSFSYPQSTMV